MTFFERRRVAVNTRGHDCVCVLVPNFARPLVAIAIHQLARRRTFEPAADQPKPNRFVNVFVEDEDIRYLEGLDTGVSDGDEIVILPAVAGGS